MEPHHHQPPSLHSQHHHQIQQLPGFYFSLLCQPQYKDPIPDTTDSSGAFHCYPNQEEYENTKPRAAIRSTPDELVQDEYSSNEFLLPKIKFQMPQSSSSKFTEMLYSNPSILLDSKQLLQYPILVRQRNDHLASMGGSSAALETCYGTGHVLSPASEEACSSHSSQSSVGSYIRDSPSACSYQRADATDGLGNRRRHASSSESKNVHVEANKKPKPVPRSSCPPLKVGKEKLGDRIASLQRLVAPYGKTDTASVLTEAIGYIHFLHDQVQTLSVPYMKLCNSKPNRIIKVRSESEKEELAVKDLGSRGLCLVPVSCASCFDGYNVGNFE